MANRVSNVVLNQVPEFVRSDYPTFIAFLEAYYEYMDAQAIDVIKLRDLDESLEQFIKYFKSELAINLPETTQVNERFLLKNIKDLYLAKGSEASFKLLFKILYNKEVDVQYPGKQMLRASDGRWKQDISIFVRVVSGSIASIVNAEVNATNSSRTIKLLVDRYSTVNIRVDNIAQISSDTYEVFIDRKYYGVLLTGDKILYEDKFSGVIVNTTSNISISSAGSGFRVGQLFELNVGDATGTLLKITKVSSIGAILTAEIVKFGIGYESTFTVSLDPSNDYTSSHILNNDLTESVVSIGLNATITDTLSGFSEQGFIAKVDYLTSDAWDLAYCGELLSQFSETSTLVATQNSDLIAQIHVGLGPLARYPGYYITNDGFLNDAIFIQDSNYYQVYSYILKISERLETYRTAVRNMIHPAGTELFGEFQIQNDFDVNIELSLLLSLSGHVINDESLIVDSGTSFSLNKVLDDASSPDDSIIVIRLNGDIILPIYPDPITSSEAGYISLNPYAADDVFAVTPIVYDNATIQTF